MKLLLALITAFVTAQVNAATIDTTKSSVRWQGTKMTGRHFGDIQIKKGSLDVNSKTGLAESGEVTIDMNSFKADDLSGRMGAKIL